MKQNQEKNNESLLSKKIMRKQTQKQMILNHKRFDNTKRN